VCALQAHLHNVLSSLLDSATVVWFIDADTLPLLLFFDGCFAVVAVRMDTLPSRRFGRPLMPAVEGVMAPYCRYFAAFSLEDALLPWLGSMLCAAMVHLFSVDTLPLWLHLLCWQPCIDVFFLIGSVVRFVVESLSLPPSFCLLSFRFLTTSSMVL
jgi:hypothetical protein